MKKLLFLITLNCCFTLSAEETTAVVEDPHTPLDYIWILLATALVFLMQAGFMFLESGLAQAKNSINVAVKNISDFILAVTLFWLIGYGFMFGADLNGWGFIGSDLFMFTPPNAWDANMFIFQAVFCGTAATITSGAIAGRTKFQDYLVLSALVSVLVYPVFGHWVWGGGWLSEMGFMDFAGSTVVHSVGAWVALAGIIVVGPRLRKFDENGKARKLPPHSILSAYLGGLILFFGWFGFNCGSTLEASKSVAIIAMNTILAAAFGGLAAMFLSWKFGDLGLPEPEFILNGVLGGLVGITAGCDAVSTLGAVLIGLSSGAVSYYGSLWIENGLKLDDVVGAVAVHGLCGAWGTLIFPVFIETENLFKQLGIQAIGILACFLWTFPLTFVILKVIKKLWGLRIPAEMELAGLNVSEHGVKSTLHDIANSMFEVKNGKDIGDVGDVEYQKGTEMGDIAEGYNSMLQKIKTNLKESQLQKEIAEAAKMKADLALEKIETSQKDLEVSLKEAEQAKLEAKKALEDSEQQRLKNLESEASLEKIEAEREKIDKMLAEITEKEKTAQQQKGILQDKMGDAGDRALLIGDAISKISNEGKRVIKDINELADQSKQLTEQLSGLSGIAENTKFLSFNASIEAANTGELGRGFAVIASNIRELAVDSGKFAEEIYRAISSFENQFQQVFSSIEKQGEHTNAMSEHIEHLKEIFEMLKQLDDQQRKVLV